MKAPTLPLVAAPRGGVAGLGAARRPAAAQVGLTPHEQALLALGT